MCDHKQIVPANVAIRVLLRLSSNVNTAGLRPALWLCDLCAELPHLSMAVLDPNQSITELKNSHLHHRW